jgi:predicted RNA binding protein YcfA (HicA-like mRNA interferase family)
MPKLPQVSGPELVKAFTRLGFEVISQKGSHIKMRDRLGRTAIIPNHKQIKQGTLHQGILKPNSISIEELIRALRK